MEQIGHLLCYKSKFYRKQPKVYLNCLCCDMEYGEEDCTFLKNYCGNGAVLLKEVKIDTKLAVI